MISVLTKWDGWLGARLGFTLVTKGVASIVQELIKLQNISLLALETLERRREKKKEDMSGRRYNLYAA
jgi:hypothetical protein